MDETVDLYRRLRLPDNWTIHYEPEWGSIGASMRWCLQEYPDATQYGWLADDTEPRTPGWDTRLEQAAGNMCLSYGRDLYLSELWQWEDAIESGRLILPGLCWGGDLVRRVGWWCPPWLVQAGIDTTWSAIVAELRLGRYCRDVVVEHMTYLAGKREKDDGDRWDHYGDNYVVRDVEAQAQWLEHGLQETLACFR